LFSWFVVIVLHCHGSSTGAGSFGDGSVGLSAVSFGSRQESGTE
jgi:hypothetical protein